MACCILFFELLFLKKKNKNPIRYGQKKSKAENKIFHSQTNVAPMIPKIGPRKGVKVRKREMINKTPSRKVL